ncbi:MAG: DUF5683 domain-containing protein [Chitinophagales bacterium]
MRTTIPFLISLMLLGNLLTAQEIELESDSPQFIPSDTIPKTAIDSIPQIGIEGDSVVIAAKKKPTLLPDSILKKRSKRAAMWSLIPGGGQIYNKQYWKAPIYGGLIVGGAATTIYLKGEYNVYQNAYKARLNNQVLQNPDYQESERTAGLSLVELRDKRRTTGQNYTIGFTSTAIIYGVNIIDAFVSSEIKRKNRPHSPLRAATRSALLPGLGQAYNRKYWKIPIIYGGLGFTGYLVVDHFKKRQLYRDQYLALTREGYGTPPISADKEPFLQTSENALNAFESRDRLLAISILFTGLIYAINIIDATIDAHLYDFDVSDDLSLRVEPHFGPDEFGKMGFRGVRWVVGF